MHPPVNINCDLGEGLDNEATLMPLIHSCNIACGGHAGDKATMKRVVELARKFGVAIGAHPSYPDREHFGRVSLKMEDEAFKSNLKQQLDDFVEVLGGHTEDLHHIKAHGALYNDLAVNESLARNYLEVLEPYKANTLLYVPFDSVLERMALETGFKVAVEAFGDRNYNDDLTLVSRRDPEALITENKKVLAHVQEILRGWVTTVEGHMKPLKADTICMHSDTANAVANLEYLKMHLNY
ncbi:LamB/YcsF family protein [Robertkochia sediminum]|uniref:LamB/YcsF family protein n=1 Tax=Robertkochia sediminum TaxID=2785326 RepID=UPI001933279C|nr:LamB/YcsF family protein [Robertkochia sediminum]MBL7473371.1 LamB/YcsF family protein [Robertkochia sediminum]